VRIHLSEESQRRPESLAHATVGVKKRRITWARSQGSHAKIWHYRSFRERFYGLSP
jgi:hypothetical protein